MDLVREWAMSFSCAHGSGAGCSIRGRRRLAPRGRRSHLAAASTGPVPEKEDGTPAAGRFAGWPKRVADLRVLDPCCGSGHFLVTAFEMLRRMRMVEEGLGEAEAADAVLRENLFGLEIDPAYVDTIVRRWQAFTGETAQHAATGQAFDETARERGADHVG